MKTSLILALPLLLTLAPASLAQENQAAEAPEAISSTERNERKKTTAAEALKGLTPTQAYLEIRRAIMNARSMDELVSYMSTESASQTKKAPAVAGDGVLKMIKMMMPKEVKVTAEKINGDEATLTAIPLKNSEMDKGMNQLANGLATGLAGAFGQKPPAGQKKRMKTVGTILMRKEDGVWKQHKAKWHTSSGSSTSSEKPKNQWCAAAAKAKLPQKPAKGKLYGRDFIVNQARYNKNMHTLTLAHKTKSFGTSMEFTIFLFDKKSPLGRAFVVPANEAGITPHVHTNGRATAKGSMKHNGYTSSDGYGMRLQFNKAPVNGKLTGYIVLRLPDKDKSHLSGYFYADMK